MSHVLSTLVNMVFPRVCAGCGASSHLEAGALCWECRSRLPLLNGTGCARCGMPVYGRVDHEFECRACTDAPPACVRARAALLYDGLGRELVTRFKYRHLLWAEPLLVDLLEQCVLLHYRDVPFDAVCPVPLHPARQRARGYNQAALMASGLASRLRLGVIPPRILVRTRMTGTQTRLTARQRITNVMGAFKVRRPERVRGKRILLVDDVMTTGATVNACAKALMGAGAETVYAVTAARGM